MKKVLLVSSRFPFPLNSGFASKNLNLIKALSRKYDVDFALIDKTKPSKRDIEYIGKYINNFYFFRPTKLDICIGILRSMIKLMPIHFGLFYSRKARKKIKELSNNSDLAVGSVARIWPYLANLKIPIYMDLADSLTLIYRNNYKVVWNLALKFFYFTESILMKGLERQIVETSKNTFVFNKIESEWLSKFNGLVTQVPHGVAIDVAQKIEEDETFSKDIIIFGKMDFHPNEDAVLWFAKTILPKLPSETKLIAMGASPSSKILNLAQNNSRVVVTGFVEDPYPLIAGSLASIAPIRLGGGIQNKVLDSLASGASIIVSRKVAKALPDFKTSGIYVCDNDIDWINTIETIKNSKHLKNSLKEKGRAYIDKNFSWDAYQDSIIKHVTS